MLNVVHHNLKVLATRLSLWSHKGVNTLNQSSQRKLTDIERYLTAFDLAHVEHIVNQSQQVLAGSH